jgi:hypothetical protein
MRARTRHAALACGLDIQKNTQRGPKVTAKFHR